MSLPDFFGPEVAARYDADSGSEFRPEVLDPVVERLAKLAGDGPALELAIGTGRVALPLAARGVEVSGIELSEAMVAQLRAKPGGDRVAVTLGDMATTRVGGEFSLVYLVFNTIGNLTTQDQQVACFANAAAHLRPGGCFVVEVGVPALLQLSPGERFVVFTGEPGRRWGIDEYDLVGQGLVSHHIDLGGPEPRVASVPFRYVWPAELDLMARLAGMRLRERWADWERSPFTAASPKHVSVWELPG
jgi:SAM-dependent methyltransferase